MNVTALNINSLFSSTHTQKKSSSKFLWIVFDFFNISISQKSSWKIGKLNQIEEKNQYF